MLISISALLLINYQAKKLVLEQSIAVENMIRQSKEKELQNYIKLARTAVEPFYQWDNVSRLQAQKQVADMISRMTYGKDGYFFLSRQDGGALQNPLLDELENIQKFSRYGQEANLLLETFPETEILSEKPYQYNWDNPSTGEQAEKIGQSFSLANWNWIIGSGLYTDDIKAQIGTIQKQLTETTERTKWVLTLLAIGAISLTALLLAFVRFSEQKFADKKLKELATEIVDAQENERKRVSTELHDGISQLLVSANYSLDIASAKTKKNSGAQKSIDQSIQTISNAITEVRRISIALRPSILDDVGLAAALKSIGTDFETQTGIKTKVSAEHIGNVLDDREKTSVFRVAQEALANIAKHSNATDVKVRLMKRDGEVTLQITDNGDGTEPKSNNRVFSGMGLRNMQERIESHDGIFQIKFVKGFGVTVKVILQGKDEIEKKVAA